MTLVTSYSSPRCCLGDKPDRSDESCIWARILQMNVRLDPHSSGPEPFDRNMVLDGFTLIACGGYGQLSEFHEEWDYRSKYKSHQEHPRYLAFLASDVLLALKIHCATVICNGIDSIIFPTFVHHWFCGWCKPILVRVRNFVKPEHGWQFYENTAISPHTAILLLGDHKCDLIAHTDTDSWDCKPYWASQHVFFQYCRLADKPNPNPTQAYVSTCIWM